MKYLNPTPLLLTLLITLMSLAHPTHAEDKKPAIEPYEAWFVMNMGGQKAGHMHVTLKEVDGRIISQTQMKIAIKRGDVELKIEQASSFVESLKHEPISAESSMSLGAIAMQTKLDFTGPKWKMTTGPAGQQTTSEVDTPQVQWLTPGALSVAMEAAIERDDKEITVTTLDLSMGIKPVTMSLKRGEQANIQAFGKVVPATKWTMTMDAAPGLEIEQWTDEQGQPVRQVVALLPGMEMEMLLADKDLALAEFDAPEMLAASLISPDKPIKNPRKLKQGVFELSSPGLKKALGENIVTAGHQSAQWVDADTLRVTIDLREHAPFDNDRPTDANRVASAMLDFENPAVAALLATQPIRQDAANGIPSAQAIRDFVREHIETKDLSVGFASASETARTGQGDCTEHACLLAAMLRGAGIPSRTVTGLVYADQFAGHEGVFGFHMWAQAWISMGKDKGYWLDLDAAAPGEVNGFDATHIALSTSAMKDGETFNDMVKMLPLMKGLKIKVIETQWTD